jgi:hypothetical protein
MGLLILDHFHYASEFGLASDKCSATPLWPSWGECFAQRYNGHDRQTPRVIRLWMPV